jgi:hypothetical protein
MVVVHDGRMSSDYTEVEDNKIWPTLFLNWPQPHHHRTLLQSHLLSSNNSTNGAKDHTHPHTRAREPTASTCIWHSDNMELE